MSVRDHVPEAWTVVGELPTVKHDQPLRIESPDGRFKLDVSWETEAFVGGARIDGEDLSIFSESPTAIHEWVLSALEMAKQRP